MIAEKLLIRHYIETVLFLFFSWKEKKQFSFCGNFHEIL